MDGCPVRKKILKRSVWISLPFVDYFSNFSLCTSKLASVFKTSNEANHIQNLGLRICWEVNTRIIWSLTGNPNIRISLEMTNYRNRYTHIQRKTWSCKLQELHSSSKKLFLLDWDGKQCERTRLNERCQQASNLAEHLAIIEPRSTIFSFKFFCQSTDFQALKVLKRPVGKEAGRVMMLPVCLSASSFNRRRKKIADDPPDWAFLNFRVSKSVDPLVLCNSEADSEVLIFAKKFCSAVTIQLRLWIVILYCQVGCLALYPLIMGRERKCLRGGNSVSYFFFLFFSFFLRLLFFPP